MEIVWVKVLSALAMLVVSLLFVLVPFAYMKRRRSRGGDPVSANKISVFNCFAGGVFFGTVILHLMPETKELGEEVLAERGVDVHYPLTELFISVGMFLTLALEILVHFCARNKKEPVVDVLHSHKQEINSQEPPQTNSVSPETEESKAKDSETPTSSENTTTATGKCSVGLSSLMLTIALSLHTVFEGLAIGLQLTTFNLWTLWGAILLHKVVVAATLGLRLALDVANSLRSASVMGVVFAAGSPVGIVIGALITHFDSSSHSAMAQWLLQSFASGTFFFVSFFEILCPEMTYGKHGLFRLIAMLIGFGIMAAITAWHPEHE